MSSVNVQFRIHNTGEVEWWVLNEDGSETHDYGMHNMTHLGHEILHRFSPNPIPVGDNMLLRGFRLVPFYERVESRHDDNEGRVSEGSG